MADGRAGGRADGRTGGLEGQKIIVELACDGRGRGVRLGRACVAYLGGRIMLQLGLELLKRCSVRRGGVEASRISSDRFSGSTISGCILGPRAPLMVGRGRPPEGRNAAFAS